MSVAKVGDTLEPSDNSPLRGGRYEPSVYVIIGFNGPYIIILRNGIHKFRSEPCYFKLKEK